MAASDYLWKSIFQRWFISFWWDLWTNNNISLSLTHTHTHTDTIVSWFLITDHSKTLSSQWKATCNKAPHSSHGGSSHTQLISGMFSLPYSSFSYLERWEQNRQARTFISQRVKWRWADVAAVETPADGDRWELMTSEIMEQLLFHYYKHVTANKNLHYISSFKSLAVNTETAAALSKVRGFQLCQMCPCVGNKRSCQR